MARTSNLDLFWHAIRMAKWTLKLAHSNYKSALNFKFKVYLLDCSNINEIIQPLSPTSKNAENGITNPCPKCDSC